MPVFFSSITPSQHVREATEWFIRKLGIGGKPVFGNARKAWLSAECHRRSCSSENHVKTLWILSGQSRRWTKKLLDRVTQMSFSRAFWLVGTTKFTRVQGADIVMESLRS